MTLQFIFPLAVQAVSLYDTFFVGTIEGRFLANYICNTTWTGTSGTSRAGIYTHMRSQPNDWMQIWLFAFEEGFVCRLKVGVFEELTSISAQPLYVLVVGLLEPPLQAPIHSPVPAIVAIKSRTAAF